MNCITKTSNRTTVGMGINLKHLKNSKWSRGKDKDRQNNIQWEINQISNHLSDSEEIQCSQTKVWEPFC